MYLENRNSVVQKNDFPCLLQTLSLSLVLQEKIYPAMIFMLNESAIWLVSMESHNM